MSYQATTRNILVDVKPTYLETESSPQEDYFFWAYRVRIENQGAEEVQLKKRHWSIVDSRGHNEEVHGAGVVGEEPVLKPGQSYEYTSGAPLTTPSGIMSGHYTMETPAGESFDVTIPAFSLDSPYEGAPVH